MKEKFQQFGKAMLVPISLIALSGLCLGLGGALTSKMTMTAMGVNWDWYTTTVIYNFFLVFKGLGLVAIGNLGPLYAVGCAFSLAKKEKGWAAFSAVVCYFAMLTTMEILLGTKGLSYEGTRVPKLIESGLTALEASKIAGLYTRNLGFFVYNTGVFGGIAVGCAVAWITSKFYNVKLPVALSFFAGTRTVPIISLITGSLLGVTFYIFWPTIGSIFTNVAAFVHSTGYVGTFVYRYLEECLVPFGMHPLISTPMRWTELGGSAIIDGTKVVGNSAIQLAQLASPGTEKLLVRAFMGGLGVIDYAIYPAIATAMYVCAKPENRKKVLGLLIPTIVSTVFFGVTEPILFTFLFIAPWMYFGVYAFLAATGEVLCELMKVSVFQGNIKDLIPFLLRPEKLNLWPYLILLPAFFIITFFIFKTLIMKLDIKTPGRGEAENDDDIRLISKAEYNSKQASKSNESEEIKLAKSIVAALGGKENIEDVDNCISRLRIVLKDKKKIAPDSVFIKELQAMGVIHMGEKGVQIIYGPAVAGIAADVRDVLDYK